MGSGNNTIDAGTGANDQITGGNGAETVKGGGANTKVTLGNGNNTVSLGGANDQVTVGNGTNIITFTGVNSRVIAGSGSNTIDAGTGNASVSLAGGNATLLFHRSGDIAFLGSAGSPAMNAAVTDQASGLRLNILSGGADIIANFAADPSGVVDLKNGLGGYTRPGRKFRHPHPASDAVQQRQRRLMLQSPRHSRGGGARDNDRARARLRKLGGEPQHLLFQPCGVQVGLGGVQRDSQAASHAVGQSTPGDQVQVNGPAAAARPAR